MTLIPRKPLRTQIRGYLLQQMFAGEMEPGTQVIERELTERLGVSRTPLREALLQLELEGFLNAELGKGYMVRNLVASEVRELFDVGMLLEPLALQRGGIPNPDKLDELHKIDEERTRLIDDSSAWPTLIELDNRWHQLLVSGCENSQLLEIIRLIRNRMYRYVGAFSRRRENIVEATRQHRRVRRALEKGDLANAVNHLKGHWERGETIILGLLSATRSTAGIGD